MVTRKSHQEDVGIQPKVSKQGSSIEDNYHSVVFLSRRSVEYVRTNLKPNEVPYGASKIMTINDFNVTGTTPVYHALLLI